MFSPDPPAGDIIRNDALINAVGPIAGDQCKFQLEVSKGKYEEVTGVVVATGTYDKSCAS